MSSARTFRNAIALLPCRAKPVRIVTAAEEARAMASRKRGGLVEKEQLGPAPRAHHLTPPAPEFADASEPGAARPAPLQQGPGCGIVNDAAIAGEHPAMRRRDDVAGGRDAVLQGHRTSRSPRLRGESRDAWLHPQHRVGGESPSPGFFDARQSGLSPQSGRGKKHHAAPSRIGGWNDSAVSQGKKIQVSCDTSVMKVSTSGRPFGLA